MFNIDYTKNPNDEEKAFADVLQACYSAPIKITKGYFQMIISYEKL